MEETGQRPTDGRLIGHGALSVATVAVAVRRLFEIQSAAIKSAYFNLMSGVYATHRLHRPQVGDGALVGRDCLLDRATIC